MSNPEELGYESVEGHIKLMAKDGSFTQIDIKGVRGEGKGREALAEYIKQKILERLPGAPAEIIALRGQVKQLEGTVKELTEKNNSLQMQIKAKGHKE